MTKIVRRVRDCVGLGVIIGEVQVQHIDGPLQVKY